MPETEKLKEEPKFKDQSTMVSFERLSLMIEYNQIGSLSSLGRRLMESDHVAIKRARSNSIRRGSYSIGMFKVTRGSASKVDLLKSSIEVTQNSGLKSHNGYSSGKVSFLLCRKRTTKSSTFFGFMIIDIRQNRKWFQIVAEKLKFDSCHGRSTSNSK